MEIIDMRPQLPVAAPVTVSIDHRRDIDEEADRLAQAALLAAQRHAERRRARLATARGWAMLVAVCIVPLAGAMAFPESVTKAAPAAARLYSLAGVEVNVSGFMIRNAASELQFVSGTALLAVRGEIVNVAKLPQQAPALQFAVHDATGGQIHAWTLEAVASRKLEPGEATSFLSRVAAPPAPVREVEIRFARGE